MATRTSTQVKQALKRFLELVMPIEDVRYVVAFDDEEPEISTYISKLDDAVIRQVIREETRIMDEFPDLPADFHVWFLEGRPIESFVGQLPALTYARQTVGGKPTA